ncbi:MAG: tryptophan-rich sensory protein [Bacteroidales bacterium]|nr:tryptophan-rich sensory protein [Bacteroidales bacterium]
MIYMNYLANALPLNNKTTGQLSDAYPNLFVPAGITFSIWGIIYLLLAAYCVFQFTVKGKEISSGIGWLFAISCILNGLWIVAWHYEKLPVSLIIMLGLLVTLILINIKITNLPAGLTKAAFGVYLGWICIATIANVTALLVSMNWSGGGISQEVWTIIMIAVGTLIVALTIYRITNPFIGLAVIWAFTGIILKRSNDNRLIVYAAAAGILVVAIITLFTFLRAKR